jgi:polysaccharide biosynthesis/export protein ExoF
VAAPVQHAAAAKVAANVPISPAVVHVSLDNSAPESSEPNPQGAGSLDVMRETEHQQTLIEQLKPLLAQRAVFVAEREASKPVVPKQLLDLVGEREGERLVAAQASARAAANAEIEAQDAALVANVESVKRELAALQAKLAQIDLNSTTKSDRLKLLQTAKKGSIAGTTFGEARTAITEVEERRQDVLIAIAQAEQRLTQAQQERTKLVRHTRTELEQALLSTEAQISQAAISLKTSHQVLSTLQGTAAPPPTASAALPQAPARMTDL